MVVVFYACQDILDESLPSQTRCYVSEDFIIFNMKPAFFSDTVFFLHLFQNVRGFNSWLTLRQILDVYRLLHPYKIRKYVCGSSHLLEYEYTLICTEIKVSSNAIAVCSQFHPISNPYTLSGFPLNQISSSKI